MYYLQYINKIYHFKIFLITHLNVEQKNYK